MASTNLTEDYLKHVYNAAEWTDRPVTVTVLSERLGLSPSSVSEAVRKLTDRGLLSHARYGSIELTDSGRVIAMAMVRKHRLIETFLVEYLGYDWDEVHDEAEVLEHAVSDDFVDRLAERLGHPTHDPHGDPIPAADGSVPAQMGGALADFPAGAVVRVSRVWDDDPALLRHLSGVGVDVGSVVEVAAQVSAAGTMEVRCDGSSVSLGEAAARAILAEPV